MFSSSFFQGIACVALLGLASLCTAHSAMFPDNFKFDNSNEGKRPPSELQAILSKSGSAFKQASCVDGLASNYPCRNIDLQALVRRDALGGGGLRLNDIWGWTDLMSGMEVAIVGRANGTSFVDITTPSEPVLLGFLPSRNGGSGSWRDIKVYQDYAFIVADGSGNFRHGLQIYDLTQLATVTPDATLTETASHSGFGSAHNIAINEDSGYAYIVGSSQCSGGLYMVDISTPLEPDFAGCFSRDFYTHDVQCVNYQGPDTRYFDREICIAYNEDTITIVDVSDKNNPQQLSRTSHVDARYIHQGWFLDENHTYIIMNDEGDELASGRNTESYIMLLNSLEAPQFIGKYVAETRAIDHNLYTKDGLVYESNYRAGLRILDAADIALATLDERAYFDTIPCSDTPQFSGAWSAYIDFASGNIVVSDVETGLFILRPDLEAIDDNANDVAPATSPLCQPSISDNTSSSSGSGGGGAIPLGFLMLLAMMLSSIKYSSRRD